MVNNDNNGFFFINSGHSDSSDIDSRWTTGDRVQERSAVNIHYYLLLSPMIVKFYFQLIKLIQTKFINYNIYG